MTLQQIVLAASRQADSEHPERLQRNRGVDCYRHTTRVIELLRAQDIEASYIGKTAGEGQYAPPTGFPREVVHPVSGTRYTCTGVSHDAIWIGTEHQFDLVGNGNDGGEPLGSPGVPVANEIPPQYFRPNNPPIPPGAAPVPPPPPPPQIEPYPGDEPFDAVGVALFADYALAGQAPNPQMGRWFGRVIDDWRAKREPSLDASIAKHRKEWRAALGLPQ